MQVNIISLEKYICEHFMEFVRSVKKKRGYLLKCSLLHFAENKHLKKNSPQ